jgi:DNA-binding beta-propeller fold protein YncE
MEEDILTKFKSVFRSPDANNEELSPPSGFHCTPSGNLILADDFNHRVQIYDADRTLIKSFGCKGKNPGEFHYPRGITTDREDNIYVADSWNHRIQKFDAEGNHLLSIGSCGEEHGQLNEPWDIFIAPNADILIVERYNHRIQVFCPKGKSRGWIGGRGTVLEEQLASIFETPQVFFTTPAFEFPTSIACDSHGNYFISDSGNHRILKFNAQWNLLLAFGKRGKKPGQFEYPLSVSVGPNDLLYVADLNNDRIQVFTSTGQTLYELKEAGNSLPLTAPSLTAVSPDGTLHIGLTFDTRVISFQTPAESKKDTPITEEDENPLTHCQEAVRQLIAENTGSGSDQNIDADLLLQLSRLAVEAVDEQNEPLIFQGLDMFSRHLDFHRQAVLAAHEEWQKAAVLHNQLVFAEQKQVLEQQDDPTVFNKSLFHAETRDKTGFRNLRKQFYEYRKAVEHAAEFFGNTINSNLSESSLRPCLDFAENQLIRLGDRMIQLLETKEQNEKTMLESFTDTQAQEGKWETFLIHSNSNVRILDVLRQFHFEMRSLLAAIKGAALKFPHHLDIENTLNRQFIQPQGSEKFLKILLGFQEEGRLHQSLEILLKDLIDHWMIHWGTRTDTSPVDLTLADLQPVPFDAENLTLKQMSEPLLTEGMPLRKKDAGLACGHLHFSADSKMRNEDDFIKNLWAIWENQQVYDTKYLETLQQLETLSRQQQELDAQVNRVNPQDKQAPVTLQNNLAVVKYQVSVLRRMALTMEINEADNLFSLAIGAGLLISSGKINAAPEVARLFKTLNSFYEDLEENIAECLRERKTLAFESSRLNGILNSGNENKNIEELNQVLEVKDQVFSLQTTQEKLNAILSRKFKIRSRLNKLLEFEKTCEPKNVSGQGSLPSLPCQISFANSGPLTRNLCQPYGIAKTPEDDIIVADYENHQVIRFSSQGIYKNHFGGFGNAPGFFNYPVNVQVDRQGFIYVADEKNTRIQKFSGGGRFLLSFGDHESEDQRLGAIFSLSIDREDQIWVADPEHDRIQIYSSNGELIRSLENRKNSAQELCQPVSIHCQENGNSLVGDKSSCLLKLFDSEGKLCRELKKEGLGFGEIYFIASHPDHGIFASDYWSNRILHLNAQLDVVSILNHPGQRAGQFGKVGGLVLLDDQLIVADFENFRVQVLNVSRVQAKLLMG